MNITTNEETGLSTVDIYLMIDEGGNYVVATDTEQLGVLYDENVGESSNVARDILLIPVTLRLPGIKKCPVTIIDKTESTTSVGPVSRHETL